MFRPRHPAQGQRWAPRQTLRVGAGQIKMLMFKLCVPESN
jgi:hypothetical protein